MKVYALTGGIAAGKSEASRKFIDLGIPVLDADLIAHNVMEPGGRVFDAVVAHFGDEIVSGESIDREKLSAIVFRDREQLERLNSMVHPAVGLEIAQRLAALIEEEKQVAIVEAALHAENGKLGQGMEGLILVHAPVERRLHRLVHERGIEEDEARRRIAAQSPPEDKMRLADWIIENTGSIEELHRRVEEIARELLA